MKKILPLFMVGILVLSGLAVGNALGEETNQEIQHAHHNIQVVNSNEFTIGAKYSYIRSYRGGGGIFIINITPKNDFSGFVFLWIKAAPNLNTRLDKRYLNKDSRIAEITICPNEFTEIKTHQIVLIAIHFKMPILTTIFHVINNLLPARLQFSTNRLYDYQNVSFLATSLFEIRKLVFEVEIFNWSSDNLPDAIVKKDELIKWLESKHPEFGTFSDKESFAYVTYPGILIVEHWTFLYKEWEVRICYHVMIPPHDWSKIWLRKLGEVQPIFAAIQESDGTTYEIPVSDYPTFYGY